ncbi:PIN domain-containing protein [Variovorax sp. RHLX14]|uniref:PIN domain-containing protein n=1 Tax=Variovorax sp. RHLX14 TaxID=1259731 RepID=UPI003F461C74
MAGHARYTAILDACVLYPVSVADALMSFAEADLYAAKWTTLIEDEWIRNLEADRPEPAWRALMPALKLPDPDDVHVLAAAIAGHADCIVTANLVDFPASVLEIHGVTAVHPDDFLMAQFDLDHVKAIAALRDMRGRSKKPPYDAEEFARIFERNGLVGMAERLRKVALLL